MEDTIGALLLGGRVPAAIPVLEDEGLDSSKVLIETQLPSYPTNVSAVDGKWQTVGNTR